VIDTTLRRLAGFMVQTRTSFMLQGHRVLLPPPFSLPPVVPVTSSTLTGSLCLILYSLPGNIDYPWSSATSVQFVYNPTLITTTAGTAVTVISGTGSRTYTNRFGASVTTALTIASSSNNLLYLGSAFPVDGNGMTWNLSSLVQLPGAGPTVLSSLINVFNASGVVVEAGSSRIDGLGQAFLSSVPGFKNVTIGASNGNSLAANYAACQAPITFTNGLRVPTQPSVSNGAVRFSYSYYITDGATYSVSCNLTVTTSSAFATQQDQLGNPFQTVLNVTGTRTYVFLPTGASVTSTVTGLTRSGRFYPYSLLASAPGVYSMNTVPFLDYDGLAFTVIPSVSANGVAPGSGPQYSAVDVGVNFSAPSSAVMLTESHYTQLPNPAMQQQLYSTL
jgi:hypothetical protein